MATPTDISPELDVLRPDLDLDAFMVDPPRKERTDDRQTLEWDPIGGPTVWV